MEQTSARATRLQKQRQLTRCFETVIDPNQDKIELPSDFVKAWLSELKKLEYVKLFHQNGKRYVAFLNHSVSDCYMTSGIVLSKLFCFIHPTKVIMDCKIEDAKFDLVVIKNEDVIPNPIPDDNASMPEADDDDDFDTTITENDIDGVSFPELTMDGVFSWKVHVTRAMARKKKHQVLHLSRAAARGPLLHQKSIVLKSTKTRALFKCKVKTAKREDQVVEAEKYLTIGWNEFVRHNKIKFGDILIFHLSDPPKLMRVRIIG